MHRFVFTNTYHRSKPTTDESSHLVGSPIQPSLTAEQTAQDRPTDLRRGSRSVHRCEVPELPDRSHEARSTSGTEPSLLWQVLGAGSNSCNCTEGVHDIIQHIRAAVGSIGRPTHLQMPLRAWSL